MNDTLTFTERYELDTWLERLNATASERAWVNYAARQEGYQAALALVQAWVAIQEGRR